MRLRRLVLAMVAAFAGSLPSALASGPRRVPCAPAKGSAPLPRGQGQVTGGVLVSGGPAPGGPVCSGGRVALLDAEGRVVARSRVRYRRSFALTVPAGRYELVGRCRGVGAAVPRSVTVTAGEVVHLNADCNIR